MKSDDLIKTLSHYGYDLLDYRDKPGYEERKTGAWAVVDRRTGKVVCLYSTKRQIKQWMQSVVQKSNTL